MASWAGDLSTPRSGVFEYCSNATDAWIRAQGPYSQKFLVMLSTLSRRIFSGSALKSRPIS